MCGMGTRGGVLSSSILQHSSLIDLHQSRLFRPFQILQHASSSTLGRSYGLLPRGLSLRQKSTLTFNTRPLNRIPILRTPSVISKILKRATHDAVQNAKSQPDSVPILETCPAPTCECAEMPKLDIDHTRNLNNSIAPYKKQILISTGKSNWTSRIEEDGIGTVWGDVGRQLKVLFGRGGELHNENENTIVSNSSFAEPDSVPLYERLKIMRQRSKETDRLALAPSGSHHKAITLRMFPAFKIVTFFSHHRDVLEFLLMKIRPQGLPTTSVRSDIVIGPIAIPTILICSHGGRDERCGVMGPLLHKEFEKALDVQGLRPLTSGATMDLYQDAASKRSEIYFSRRRSMEHVILNTGETEARMRKIFSLLAAVAKIENSGQGPLAVQIDRLRRYIMNQTDLRDVSLDPAKFFDALHQPSPDVSASILQYQTGPPFPGTSRILDAGSQRIAISLIDALDIGHSVVDCENIVVLLQASLAFTRTVRRAVALNEHYRPTPQWFAPTQVLPAPKVDLGMISHVGGHAFAGNVIIYTPPNWGSESNALRRTGIWYGRVEPRHVEGIVTETLLGGKIIKELFRGGIRRDGEMLRI